MTKLTKWLRPSKTQISLGICPVWSESLLCTQWVAKDPNFLHADSEDSDQTGRMPRLIWVFAGRTCHFVGFVMRRLIFFVSFYSEGWLEHTELFYGSYFNRTVSVPLMGEHVYNMDLAYMFAVGAVFFLNFILLVKK